MENEIDTKLGDAAQSSGPGQTGVPSETDRLSAAPNVPIAPSHTPGPWVVLEARREMIGRTKHFIACVNQVSDNYRGSVCNMQSCDHIKGITMDECEANARLIAAAPDLLAQLQAVESHVSTAQDRIQLAARLVAMIPDLREVLRNATINKPEQK